MAQRAGVHPSTVSRALNPATRHRLSAEVAARVIAAATELGYVPNGLAVSLRTRRSETIGVVLPDITNPVFPPILQGLEAALAEENYVAMVANAGPDPDHQRLVVERLLARQVDGLILATVTRHDSIVDLCLKARAPLVVVNRSEADHRVSSVVSDDLRGMRLAVDHLYDLGHRRIGHLGGPLNLVDRQGAVGWLPARRPRPRSGPDRGRGGAGVRLLPGGGARGRRPPARPRAGPDGRGRGQRPAGARPLRRARRARDRRVRSGCRWSATTTCPSWTWSARP